jgi:sugar phosphate isomerase/epimerase
MKLRYAYNTNGAANHRLEDALSLIADSGYDGVALTLDHHHFDPFAPEFEQRAEELAAKLERLRLGLVVETGARFLLNPNRKHEPTLLTPEPEGRKKRVEFLKLAIDLAAICRAEAVSFWAGVPRAEVSVGQARRYLHEGLAQVLEHADRREVCAAFEPEPGMFVETVADFKELQKDFPSLRIALDTGHCLASDECEPEKAVREMKNHLGTVAIEDMKRGVHEHLFFGEGEMNIPAILQALKEINFNKLVCVELSRHSHCADKIVPQAIDYLKQAENSLTGENIDNLLKKGVHAGVYVR